MIVCRMPPKPARVSPLYVAQFGAWLTLEGAAGLAIAAVVFALGCLIMFDDLVVFP